MHKERATHLHSFLDCGLKHAFAICNQLVHQLGCLTIFEDFIELKIMAHSSTAADFGKRVRRRIFRFVRLVANFGFEICASALVFDPPAL